MYEWDNGEYRFTGHDIGIITVYKGLAYVESFRIYTGIDSREALIREAREYLKIVKQMY